MLCAHSRTYLRVPGSVLVCRRNDLHSLAGFSRHIEGGKGDDVGLGVGKNVDRMYCTCEDIERIIS
jgi:hypothetical protein